VLELSRLPTLSSQNWSLISLQEKRLELRISIVEGLPLLQVLVSRECQNCSHISKFTPAAFTAF
jgi:hypothetical protein